MLHFELKVSISNKTAVKLKCSVLNQNDARQIEETNFKFKCSVSVWRVV